MSDYVCIFCGAKPPNHEWHCKIKELDAKQKEENRIADIETQLSDAKELNEWYKKRCKWYESERDAMRATLSATKEKYEFAASAHEAEVDRAAQLWKELAEAKAEIGRLIGLVWVVWGNDEMTDTEVAFAVGLVDSTKPHCKTCGCPVGIDMDNDCGFHK